MVLRPYFALQISYGQEKEFLEIYRNFWYAPSGSLSTPALSATPSPSTNFVFKF